MQLTKLIHAPQKDKRFPLYKLGIITSIETEWWLPRLGGRRNGKLVFYEYRVSVHDGQNILGTEAGDGCPAVCVYLVPPNYI